MEETRKEVEIKLRVGEPAAMRRALAKLGARAVLVDAERKARPTAKARCHEFNTLFDTPDGGLAKHGQLLRIRVEKPEGRGAARARAARTILSFKGPSAQDSEASAALHRRYKIRDEFEVDVTDADRLRLILEALGLKGWFRYEKYRTTFQLPTKQRWAAGLHLQLDETPIGAFLELEGPPEAIDRAARLLGYRSSDYITQSYLALQIERNRKRGVPTGDMLFPERGSKKSKKNEGKAHSLLDKARVSL